MLATFQQLVGNQFEATFCMLGACIDRCPAAAWNRPVCTYPFCQTAFHALFFADYYLGHDPGELQSQAYHREHTSFFGDYEQLEDREPVSLYEQPAVHEYLQFCRGKARDVIATETEESLAAPAAFLRRNVSRAELHAYNIRHLQHHAAQLSLRLRLDAGLDIPWIGSGWREL